MLTNRIIFLRNYKVKVREYILLSHRCCLECQKPAVIINRYAPNIFNTEMNRAGSQKIFYLWIGRIFIPMVLLMGATARITAWWQNRSLFIDEANLARNICEKRWTDFFGRLDYEQYAPPLFCLICKLFTQVFGNIELALRAFPLLCGLASLMLFFYIARQLIYKNWVLLITVWIFSFSEMQLRYSTEGKQYICDVAVALVIVAYSLWQSKHAFQAGIAVVLGIVAPWLSMPAVFILAGAGIVFLRNAWVANDRRALMRVSAVGVLWLLNFAVFYLLILQESVRTDALTQYHQPWFFPLFPSTKEELLQGLNLLKIFPYYTAGYTVLALATGAIGIVTGFIYSARKNIFAFLLLGIPVFICVLASGIKLYSLAPRMILWSFTLLILVQGIGWQWIVNRISVYLSVPAFIIVVIAVAGLQEGLQVFYKPLRLEEIRIVLDSVSNRFMDNDALYVHHEAWPAVAYYKDCHLHREQYQFGKRIIRGTWDSEPDQQTILTENQRHGRVWLVYSHVISESARHAMANDLQVLEAYAHRIDSIKAEGAFGYLYEY